MKPGAVNESDLHAFVDDRLDPERRAQISAYLAEHPEEAARIRDYQAINRGLHELFDSVLDEPMPQRLLPQPRSRPFRWLPQAAAAVVWVFVGSLAGWMIRDQMQPQSMPPTVAQIVDQAMLAHAVYTPEVRHPVEVAADQEKHLVAWLSKRLGAEIRAPRLLELGFELLGGRLLAADNGPAAQFMYQDENGRRLTLFVRKGNGSTNDTAFRFARKNHINVFYWIDRDLGYALIGDLDKPALTEAAHAVYQQLSF